MNLFHSSEPAFGLKGSTNLPPIYALHFDLAESGSALPHLVGSHHTNTLNCFFYSRSHAFLGGNQKLRRRRNPIHRESNPRSLHPLGNGRTNQYCTHHRGAVADCCELPDAQLWHFSHHMGRAPLTNTGPCCSAEHCTSGKATSTAQTARTAVGVQPRLGVEPTKCPRGDGLHLISFSTSDRFPCGPLQSETLVIIEFVLLLPGIYSAVSTTVLCLKLGEIICKKHEAVSCQVTFKWEQGGSPTCSYYSSE